MPGASVQAETANDPVMAGTTTTSTQSSVASTQALYESFAQFMRYGNEYMDENPLVGEPGKFVFSSSKQHLQTQQEQAARKAEQAAALKLQTDLKRAVTPQEPSRPATPQLVSAKPPKAERKQGAAGGPPKPKRRKSRAPTTPGSPLGATTPISPG